MSIYIRQQFYYEMQEEGVSFTQKASKQIAPERLLQGKSDYWVDSYPISCQRKKLLVLTDWTLYERALRSDFVYLDRVKEILLKLLTEDESGFEIWVWQETDLVPLNISNLDALFNMDTFKKIELAPKSIIQEALKAKSLNPDNWLSLDAYQLAQLASPEERDYFVNIKDLSQHKLNPAVFSSLRSYSEHITFIQDGCSDSNINTHRDWLDKHGTIRVEDKILALEKGRNLQEAINHSPSLKEISAPQQVITDDIDLAPGYLPELEIISFPRTDISAKNVSVLLKAAPNIKQINLVGAMLEKEFDLDGLILSKLQFLLFNGSNISCTDLLPFLRASPNLKLLHINCCHYLDGEFDLEDGALARLEEINLGNSNLRPQSLKVLLKASPNLIELDLNAFQHISDSLDLLPGSLIKLRNANLINSNISGQSLQNFLMACPNLIAINLQYCDNLENIFELSEDCLPNLEQIVLHDSRISCQGVATLLRASSALKYIDLSDCKNIAGNLVFSGSLSKLETIKLDKSNITSQGLQNLLKAAPNINYLDLKDCGNLSKTRPYLGGLFGATSFNLKAGSLLALKEIDLRGSSISPEDLEVLVKACPNLKTLQIENCPQLRGSNIASLYRDRAAQNDTSLANTLKASSDCSNTTRSSYGTSETLTEAVIDADTSKKETEFNIERTINALDGKHPSPSTYRIKIFDKLHVKDNPLGISDVFHLRNSETLTFKAITIPVYDGDMVVLGLDLQRISQHRYFMGIKKISPDTSWQALPGLTSYDHISHIKISPPVPYEIAYSDQTQLYYIHTMAAVQHEVKIEYLFSSKPLSQVSLPEKVSSIIEEIKGYRIDKLKLDSSSPSGQKYIDAMMEQKVGVCRHRAVIFKYIMDRDYPQYQTRVVMNGIHAFAEIWVGDCWHNIDLGGAPAILHIHETVDLTENKHIPDIERQRSEMSARIQAYRALFKTGREDDLGASAWFNKKSSKILFETSNEIAQRECLLNIYSQAKREGRAVFLIESPDDLYCASTWIEKQGDKMSIRKGPGGALYDFLNAHYEPDSCPLLLINYANFKPEDIIHFNNLLDDTRKADGIPVPAQFAIVGVQNISQKKSYRGADFTSRFDKCHIYSAGLIKSNYTEPVMAKPSAEESYSIDLYHAADWRQRLLGRWCIAGSQLTFIEGELSKAMKSGKPILIKNGPLNDRNYQFFWHRLGIDHCVGDVEVDLSRISHVQGYDWQSLCSSHEFYSGSYSNINKDGFLLNRDSFHKLFFLYVCKNNGLFEEKGLLEMPGIAHLEVVLTENLSVDQWAELLSFANKKGIFLKVKVLPGLELPEQFVVEGGLQPIEKQKPLYTPYHGDDFYPFICSTDSDVTVKKLLQINPKASVVDISELNGRDVCLQLDAKFDESQNQFVFQEKTKWLLKALQEDNGATFILKGKFSQDLLNALLPLMGQYPSRITLVTEDTSSLASFNASLHEVSYEEKLSCLVPDMQVYLRHFSKDELSALSLAGLNALVRYQKIHPNNRDTRAPWQGFYTINTAINNPPIFDLKKSEQAINEFIEGRLDLVSQALKHSPYVFIGGLTGVGKSTFIEKHFSKMHPVFVYTGEDSAVDEKKLKEWAASKGGYLFVDESNITRKNWSEFEGLFETPPVMAIAGERVMIHPENKVIFAGNPLNYGGSRHQASLFKRHGNSILFLPLPANVVYREILKPIFEKTLLEKSQDELSRMLMGAYNLLLELSEDKVLVTPRQLKSIAMLTLAECHYDKSKLPLDVMLKYMHQLLRPLLKEEDYGKFDAIVPVPSEHKAHSRKIKDFIITKSRQNTADILESLLTLRNFKREFRDGLNSSQKFGDLCSIVLESMPGLGKTKILKAILGAARLKKGDIYNAEEQSNVYYLIPVSLSFAEKERILRKAFAEGNVIVMDEINSSPMMERLVNSLLSGQTPEGDRPANPGFLLLGTQNPVSMGERLAQTEAQNKRVIKLNLGEYPDDEMVEILRHKGVSEPQSRALIAAFNEEKKTAIQQKINPPNFRDLLRVAHQIREQPHLFSEPGILEEKGKEEDIGMDIDREENSIKLENEDHFVASSKPNGENLGDASSSYINVSALSQAVLVGAVGFFALRAISTNLLKGDAMSLKL